MLGAVRLCSAHLTPLFLGGIKKVDKKVKIGWKGENCSVWQGEEKSLSSSWMFSSVTPKVTLYLQRPMMPYVFCEKELTMAQVSADCWKLGIAAKILSRLPNKSKQFPSVFNCSFWGVLAAQMCYSSERQDTMARGEPVHQSKASTRNQGTSHRGLQYKHVFSPAAVQRGN